MEVRDRILLPLYKEDTQEKSPNFDLGSLFLNLLLFDTVIISSLALEDIAALAKSLGVGKTIELLDSGSVKIRAAADSIASIKLPDPRMVRLLHLTAVDPDESFDIYLKSLDNVRTTGPERTALAQAIHKQWIRPTQEDTWGTTAISDALREIVNGSRTFHVAVEQALKDTNRTIKITSSSQVSLEIVDPSTQTLRFKYRIPGLDVTTASKVIAKACRGVAGLNGVFNKMKRDQAITVISDDSVHLMEEKLKWVWQNLPPSQKGTSQFKRVISILKLPDFNRSLVEGTVNIERFLKVRQSSECEDFKSFLTQSGGISDDDIKSQLGSLKSKLGDMVRSDTGKLIRLMATTLAGALFSGIEGVALGVGASSADSFLIERLFPKSGIASFIGRQYPSIFKG